MCCVLGNGIDVDTVFSRAINKQWGAYMNISMKSLTVFILNKTFHSS